MVDLIAEAIEATVSKSVHEAVHACTLKQTPSPSPWGRWQKSSSWTARPPPARYAPPKTAAFCGIWRTIPANPRGVVSTDAFQRDQFRGDLRHQLIELCVQHGEPPNAA